MDEINLESKLTPVNIARDQTKDVDIQKAIPWIKNKTRPDTTKSSYNCQKYHKQLNRLVFADGILYRKFFDRTGRNFTKTIFCAKTIARRTNF